MAALLNELIQLEQPCILILDDDYFFQEVLSTLPEELQEFLLQTSILPRLTAALCDAVLEREGSSKLLEALHNGDLFIIPLDATGEWGRYQALFAEAMQQEARKRLGEVRLRRVAAGQPRLCSSESRHA